MNTSFFKTTNLLTIVVSVVMGAAISYLIIQSQQFASQDESDQPLYWVAPMDANYRRDAPGLSPMGMELVPVYEVSENAMQASKGTVIIDPSVVNNLGVRTAQAHYETLSEQITTVGYVKYDENKLIHIHPRVSGWIDQLFVNATGDPVTKGSALYSLYSPELVNAQEELLLALNRDNKRLIRAAEDRLKALQIPIQFIQELKRDRTLQQTITFYSPQDGVVDNLNIREGFYVQPGTMLFSIGALDNIWVEAEVFERQASLVSLGAQVSMTVDYLPGQIWQGQVDYIYPTLDSKTRTMKLRIEFANPEQQLLPNMFTQVSINSKSDDALLLIPREALIQTRHQDRVVLAMGDGRFKSIAVKVGQLSQRHAQILTGLNEGERVVSSAQFLLDSESSKTSDFKRLDQRTQSPSSTWVSGTVKAQANQARIVSVSHAAIEVWDMQAMTMDFDVADHVNINPLVVDTDLHMQIQMGNEGRYEIIDTHILSTQGKLKAEPKHSHQSTTQPTDHAHHDHGIHEENH